MAELTTPKSSIPHLAVTLGDPAGIGSEIILKALADSAVTANCQITVIGSRILLEKTYQQLHRQGEAKIAAPANLSILDVSIAPATAKQINWGEGNAVTGAVSFAYLEKAIALTLTGQFQGIVTAPIAKSCWQAAGYDYPGQTEVLATQAGVSKYGMLFVARSPYTGWTLRTLLATTHIPLAAVPEALSPELMSLKLDLLVNCLQTDFGIDAPQIVIPGLNPHSGEQGKLGTEEQDWLIPWLATARQKYPQIDLWGPVPPDTMWIKPGQAWYGHSQKPDAADAYLALYHDQGLIPVKLMAFEEAVNTTIGLPFIRTSPDHGTAFDIAGRGIANASSMKVAIELAEELTQTKFKNSHGTTTTKM